MAVADGAPAGATATGVLRVAVDCPLRSLLDYLPPAGMSPEDLPPGARVRVPMGARSAVGVILAHAGHSPLPPQRLRRITALLDVEPLFDTQLLELLRWTASYYQHPPGEVLAAALPAALRAGQPATAQEAWLALTEDGRAAAAAGEPRRAPRQRELAALLAAHAKGLPAAELDTLLPDWRDAARALARRGWTEQRLHEAAPAAAAAAAAADAAAHAPAADAPPALSAAQAAAVAAIEAGADRFGSFLLQGATGSGKTEVYLRLVASALERGAGALVLVPEIGLTPQLLERFRSRLRVPIAVLHSALSDGERLQAWRAARAGTARVVIGTRSAVFAPLRAPGLIVVDEEHDSSYKQQEGGCRYSARDVAVRRAQQLGVPVVLGSATPALESLHNVRLGRYRQLLLPRRADQAAAPRIALIDLRAHAVHAGLAGPVTQAIARHLAGDGQVLVYLNRRGYAPTLLCTSCGWIAPCTECDARLTVHRGAAQLRCHYCGASQPLPTRCGRCGFAVRPVGQGTERIAETLAAMFPDAPLARLDRDTVHSAADMEAVMRSLLDGSARILVGTQMVTKGHHFPGVSLVAVINADQGLFSADFRAAERLAQTIVQVAGRAGRGARAGEVLIQTEYPEHPLLQDLIHNGYEGFAAGALAEREAARWPPFARLALLRASARTAAAALDFLRAARECATDVPPARLLGPVPASMARRAGRHHAQLLIEAAGRGELHRFLEQWLPRVERLPAARRVRWAIDVDPLDLQ
ncbi:MAG TPA: primosomal protein N' [Steroidobacteraceae bacterium]|nr:primosomal protein N' [Steroidobacteraceae bacterium]